MRKGFLFPPSNLAQLFERSPLVVAYRSLVELSNGAPVVQLSDWADEFSSLSEHNDLSKPSFLAAATQLETMGVIKVPSNDTDDRAVHILHQPYYFVA